MKRMTMTNDLTMETVLDNLIAGGGAIVNSEQPGPAPTGKARWESFSQAIAAAHRVSTIAIGTLAKVMTDPMAPFAWRVSAASAVLKFVREAIELDDLSERLESLEATVRRNSTPVAGFSNGR